jgi:osmotically-inducible protein OsmY
MKSDSEIRADVIKELEWDPRITRPEEIGVAVLDGAVTLTGHVSTYSEKVAAARAAERVAGVKAVANELEVRLTDTRRDDADIARAIAHVLDWNTNVPAAQVKAVVENGWVTLEGVVEYSFQRDEVERMVRNVRGVLGVTNNIEVRPRVSADDVQALITETLKRQAELDARRIRVEVTDHTAHLYGHLHSVREAAAARAAASRAPGIARVEDHLAVVPER